MKYFAVIEAATMNMISCAAIPESDSIKALDTQLVIETTEAVYNACKIWSKRWCRDEENFVYDAAAGAFGKIKWSQTPGEINKTTASADQVDTITISGLVNPTSVRIPGMGIYVVEDGVLNLTFDLPGIYAAYCAAARHTMKVFQITVI